MQECLLVKLLLLKIYLLKEEGYYGIKVSFELKLKLSFD